MSYLWTVFHRTIFAAVCHFSLNYWGKFMVSPYESSAFVCVKNVWRFRSFLFCSVFLRSARDFEHMCLRCSKRSSKRFEKLLQIPWWQIRAMIFHEANGWNVLVLVINNNNDDERWWKMSKNRVEWAKESFDFSMCDSFHHWRFNMNRVLDVKHHRWKIDLNRLLATKKWFSVGAFFFLFRVTLSLSSAISSDKIVLLCSSHASNYDCSLQTERA